MSYSETTPHTRKSVGSRLWWFLKTVLITFLLLAILLALVSGGYVGLRELQRSFTSVNTRVDATEQSLALLRSDVNTLMGDDPEQSRQLETLQADLDDLQTQLAQTQTSLSDDLAAQSETLAALETSLNETITALTARADALEENQAALQGDINANTTAIDGLGGDIDAARAEVVALGGEVDDLQTTATTAVNAATNAALISDTVKLDVANMQQTLALFRAWELITRARLRLLDNNVGLATTDAQTASALLALLTPALPEAETEALTQAQSRLELALANLPGNPAGAALDLERAWDELDTILSARMGLPETAVNPTDTTGDTTETAVPTATPEPTPTP